MSKSEIFRLLSLSFLVGVMLDSFSYPFVWDSSYFFWAVLLDLIVLFVFYRNKKTVSTCFSILLFVSGMWVTSCHFKEADDFRKESVEFSGKAVIVAEPKPKDGYQEIVARPMGENWSFLLKGSAYQDFSYGDVLNVSTSLEIPENKDEKFDYRMYLAKEGIFYVSKKAIIEKTSEHRGSRIFFRILEFKKTVQKKIDSSLPVPQSGLLEGLILGGSSGLPKELQDAFSRTGTTHIVAVSGYNVTIIAEYLMMLGILIGLWRKQAFWFAAVGIAAFVFMCGLPASAVRAGVMGTLILWAAKNGRLANSGNAILFAASVMLVSNPLLFRYDAGFQLSFMATLGIIYLYPKLEKYFSSFLEKRSTAFKFLFETALLTFSAQLSVLPILIYSFGSLSVISLLANLLILPTVTPAMMLGFFAVATSLVSFPIDRIFFWLCFVILKYETITIRFLSGIKYASFDNLSFPWWGMVVWYIILLGMMNGRKIKMRISKLK